jgi:hypothetical protein
MPCIRPYPVFRPQSDLLGATGSGTIPPIIETRPEPLIMQRYKLTLLYGRGYYSHKQKQDSLTEPAFGEQERLTKLYDLTYDLLPP